jgi:hypothetical protein
MFNELPKKIQEEIMYYLTTNNFAAAKALRDDYINSISLNYIQG